MEELKIFSDSKIEYMWKCVSASFFYYPRTRSGDIAKELLKEFNDYLITDAYAGYEKVENIKRELCWSHFRRYFVDNIPLDTA